MFIYMKTLILISSLTLLYSCCPYQPDYTVKSEDLEWINILCCGSITMKNDTIFHYSEGVDVARPDSPLVVCYDCLTGARLDSF